MGDAEYDVDVRRGPPVSPLDRLQGADSKTRKLTPPKGYQGNLGEVLDYNSVGIETRTDVRLSTTRLEEIRCYLTNDQCDRGEHHHVRVLESVIIEGRELCSLVYTHRSVTVAIPQLLDTTPPDVKRSAEAEIEELYSSVLDRACLISRYQDEAHDKLKLAVDYIQANQPISPVLLWSVARGIDCCLVLAELLARLHLLKDISFISSISSKLSHELKAKLDQAKKICAGPVGEFSSQPLINNLFSFFLSKWQDALVPVCNLCAAMVDERKGDSEMRNRYYVPDEKHTALRVAAFLLGVLDSPAGYKNRKEKKWKALKYDTLEHVLKRHPYVPLFAEMSLSLDGLLSKCINYSMHRTPESHHKLKATYLIAESRTPFQERFLAWMCQWGACRPLLLPPEVEMRGEGGGEHSTPKRREEVAKTLQSAVQEGLSLLCKMMCAVKEQASWKTNNMKEAAKEEGVNEKEFRLQQLAGSYTVEERKCLLEVIGMIRGIAKELLDNIPRLEPLLQYAIHHRVQHFFQEEIEGSPKDGTTSFLRKAEEKKYMVTKNALLFCLRHLADKGEGSRTWADRTVSPTLTAITLMQIALHPVAYPKKRELSEWRIKAVQKFLAESEPWPYLLHLQDTLAAVNDLSFLWFREMALKAVGEVVFPFDYSLPVLMVFDMINLKTDHGEKSKPSKPGEEKEGGEKINKSAKPAEALLLPFSIYHDVADVCLRRWKCKYMFEEVQGEVALLWDLMIAKLSRVIFFTWKKAAACELLDKEFRAVVRREPHNKKQLHPQVDEVRAAGSLKANLRCGVRQERVAALLSLPVTTIMGKALNISNMLAQEVNNLFSDNALEIIKYAEMSPITRVVEVKMLMDILLHSHRSLCTAGLRLERFEDILQRENQEVAVLSFHSRLAQWVRLELAGTLDKWKYNSTTQRFSVPFESGKSAPTRSKWLFGSDELTKQYNGRYEVFHNYFGTEHAEALVRLIPNYQAGYIVSDLLNSMEEVIAEELLPFLAETTIIPSVAAITPPDTGSVADYIGYYDTKLDFIRRDAQRRASFDMLQYVGNVLALLHMLDRGWSYESVLTCLVGAPFLGAHLPGKEGEEDATLSADNIDLRAKEDPIPSELRGVVFAPGEHVEKLQVTHELQSLYIPGAFVPLLQHSFVVLRKHCRGKAMTPVRSPQQRHTFGALFAALMYCFTATEKELDEVKNGEGFYWGGAALLIATGQVTTYMACNIIDTLLSLQASDETLEGKDGDKKKTDHRKAAAMMVLENAARSSSRLKAALHMLQASVKEEAPTHDEVPPPSVLPSSAFEIDSHFKEPQSIPNTTPTKKKK